MTALVEVTAELLRQMPLPLPEGNTDKDSRGIALVVGGSPCAPGAVMLSGLAALRGGAGKALLAVPRSVSSSIAAAFLEAGVTALAETPDGDPAASACEQVCGLARGADAVLIGPGLMGESAAQELALGVLRSSQGRTFILDAMALTGLWNAQEIVQRHQGRVVLTPHAGEMASLTGLDKERITADPERIAREAAERLNCIVVLKGADTYIATPAGQIFRHSRGVVGLATAGSGDVMAGLLVGLASRGAYRCKRPFGAFSYTAEPASHCRGKSGPWDFWRVNCSPKFRQFYKRPHTGRDTRREVLKVME